MSQLRGGEKWGYAIGNIPYAVKDAAFINFVVFYYTQVLGISGTLAGLAMLIALSWDAITDPLVGSWSDTVRSRWGRRHPLMLLGGLPAALMFLLLFNPPSELNEFQVFLWLLFTAIAMRTFLTINYIPYQAMGAELSTDYDQRTVIAKSRVTVSWIAGIVLPAFTYIVIFQASGETDGRLIAENYHYYGVLSCVLALVALAICLWGTRSAIPRLPQADSDRPPFRISQAITDFTRAASNRNFRVSIGTKLAFGVCAGTTVTLSLYMGTYFWEFSTIELAGLSIPTFLGTLTAFVSIHRLGQRFDKPRLIAALCLIFFFNSLWFIGARLLDLLPENGHPLIYLLQLLSTFISIYTVVCVQILSASLLADILDEQEVATGLRQEGVFFGASAFVYKATTGLGNFIGGVAIDLAGLQPGTAPDAASDSSLITLGLIAGPGISVGILVAWYFATRIRLSRAQVNELRAQLA